MNLPLLKKIAAFYARFTLSFTQVGFRWRSLFWPSTRANGQLLVLGNSLAGSADGHVVWRRERNKISFR